MSTQKMNRKRKGHLEKIDLEKKNKSEAGIDYGENLRLFRDSAFMMAQYCQYWEKLDWGKPDSEKRGYRTEYVRYTRLAAECGHEEAQFNYACHEYRQQARGGPELQKFKSTVQWYADRGVTSAQCEMGMDYLNHGREPETAAHYFSLACEQLDNGLRGSPEARIFMSSLYRQEKKEGGVEKDLKAASRQQILRDREMEESNFSVDKFRVIQSQLRDSAFNLAVVYEKAAKGAKDANAAMKFYQIAADEGHTKAKDALARLLPLSVASAVSGMFGSSSPPKQIKTVLSWTAADWKGFGFPEPISSEPDQPAVTASGPKG